MGPDREPTPPNLVVPAGIYRVNGTDVPVNGERSWPPRRCLMAAAIPVTVAFREKAALKEECYGSDWLHPQIHIGRDGCYRAPGKRVRSERRRLESNVHVFIRVRGRTKRSAKRPADRVGARDATCDAHLRWGCGSPGRRLRFRFHQASASLDRIDHARR